MHHVEDESIESDDQPSENLREFRKPYQAPAIIHELHLETRAGSPIDPIGLTNMLNPFDPRGRV